MKKFIILLTFVLCASHALSQSTDITKEIIDNDTVIWVRDNNLKGDLGKYVYIYITSDKIKTSTITGENPENSIAYVIGKTPFKPKTLFYYVISQFTLEEIRVLLQSENNRPMVINFILDTRGEVTNIKFFINPDIASKFSSREISRIRNFIKSRFKFKNDPNYKPYNYVGYTCVIKKEDIISIFEQIIKNENKDNKSNEKKES